VKRSPYRPERRRMLGNGLVVFLNQKTNVCSSGKSMTPSVGWLPASHISTPRGLSGQIVNISLRSRSVEDRKKSPHSAFTETTGIQAYRRIGAQRPKGKQVPPIRGRFGPLPSTSRTLMTRMPFVNRHEDEQESDGIGNAEGLMP